MFNLFGNKLKKMNIEELSDQSFVNAFKEDNNAMLIDVRTPGEIRSGYIPNAHHMDVSSNQFLSDLAKLDKNKNYYVYCRSGMRSSTALKKMRSMGFSEKLVNMKNGILGYTGELKS